MNTIDLGQPIHEWKDLSGGEKEEVHMFIRSVYLMIITVLTILLYVVFHNSKKSWEMSVFPFATSPRPGSWRSTSWKPKTWRRWMWEDCQVNTHSRWWVWCSRLLWCTVWHYASLPQIPLLRWCCSTTGSESKRRRHQSNKTLWILTSMRASASRSPSPRSRFVSAGGLDHFFCVFVFHLYVWGQKEEVSNTKIHLSKEGKLFYNCEQGSRRTWEAIICGVAMLCNVLKQIWRTWIIS